jgi:hypothetical protein
MQAPPFSRESDNAISRFGRSVPIGCCALLPALVAALLLAATPASASLVTAFAAQTDLGVVTLGANAGGLPVVGNDGGPNGGLNGSLIAPGGGFPTFLGASGDGALVASANSAVVAPLPLFQPAQAVGGLQFGNGAGGGITVSPFAGPGPGGGVFWAPYTLSDGNRFRGHLLGRFGHITERERAKLYR